MAHQPVDQTTSAVEQTLDREWELIREGMALVAGGHAPRVVVTSLRFGEQLLDSARPLATEMGVRLVPLWTSDESASGIAIEKVSDG